MSYSRLSDPEYRNWITVGRAIQITRNGLESIIQNAVDKYHTSLLATLPSNIHAWKSHLTKAHRSTDKRKICWSNSDNSQWLTAGASWEIAKIFMAPLGPRKLDVVNAKTTDISGLLNVLEWSPRGTNGGVSLSKLADVRGARNLWAHAPSLHTTDADKADAFAFFTSILQDPHMQHDKDVQYAINELSNLLKTGLVVIEENELEILVQLQRQLGQDMVCLGKDINCWKDQVDATLEQVKSQKESLKKFVKKNGLQNVLETVQKKISDFEGQVVHELQSTNSRLDKFEENASAESQQFFFDDRSELKFDPVCDRMKEEFVGREWLFSTINSWLEKDLGPRESRVFLIWGGPGTGKSSFAQELVRRHEKLDTLAGYHYCQKDNPRTCDLELLVYNLSRMLKKSLSGYAALVAGLKSTADKFRDQSDKLFDLLITTPLQQLEENTKHFLVIDGMDEGDHEIASCFVRLSATLPSWLRVILTARHNAPALSNLFPESDVASLDHFIPSLKSLPVSHRNIDEDIREFVSMKYRTLLSKYKYIIPSFFENEREGIEKIVKASKNCFLYAKLVMEHIFDGHDEIGLPASLSEVYCLDFKRHFPDVEFFKKKVAPVLEIVLAIQCANAFVLKDMLINYPLITSRPDRLGMFGMLVQGCEEGEEFVNGVVESGLLPGIRVRDLNKGLKLLSGYLVRTCFGKYYFTHSSVRDWLQDEKSDFFCDIRNGHSIVATYTLKILKDKVPSQEDHMKDGLIITFFGPALVKCFSKRSYSNALLLLKSFFIRYLFHSRYLPEPGSSNVNVLITELGIEAIDLLHVAFDPMDGSPLLPFVRSENMAIKVLNETDVLNKMSSKEKAEHLELAIKSNCTSITAKFFGSACWIFSSKVISVMTEEDIIEKCLQFVQKNESLPQFFYSLMCSNTLGLYFNFIVSFCQKHGEVLDVCFPEFCKNTKGFDSSTCWNEDVQEYFRKLKSGNKNVITLESLKEMPFYPEEDRVSELEFTLEIIQKPLSGSDFTFPCRFTW